MTPKDINEYMAEGIDVKKLVEKAEKIARGRLTTEFEEENFITEYIRIAEEVTDAPHEFHFFLAYALVGAYLRKRCWVRWGANIIYPNFYLVTLAPSSSFRKSTALAITDKILKKSGTKILPADFTIEALIDTLGRYPQAAFIHYELKTLLAILNKDYNSNAKAFLTEIYDSPETYIRSTKGAGEIEITNPCISILACTTLEWFVSEIKEGDVEGGFLARFIYVPAFEKDKSMPIPAPLEAKEITKLLSWLKDLNSIEGELILSNEAKDVWIQWYNEQDAKIKETHPSLAAFMVRLQTYTIKIAMLNSLIIEKSLTISAQSMVKAIEIVEWLIAQIAKIMTNDISTTKFGKDLKRVLKAIKKNKEGVSYKNLMKNMELSARQTEEIVSTLAQSGQVEVKELGERGGRWVVSL
jgi:hypothetical protein